jgi:hypothetical protein
MTSLSAEELAIHNQQKSEILERIGDAFMKKFFQEYEDVKQTVLQQKAKQTTETTGGKSKAHTTSGSSMTARQRAHQAQAQALLNQGGKTEAKGKGDNKGEKGRGEEGEPMDREFIVDLKHRLEYSRDENLKAAFKNYLDSRTTCHEAKKSIDPRLLDLKDVVNTFLRNH